MTMHINEVSFAVDEHIWGHRLYDEQLPHLTVLEFLTVLQSNLASPLNVPPGEKVVYQPQHQIRLRSLLFNNPYVEVVRSRLISDEAKWDAWTDLFRVNATEMGDLSLDHLKSAFLCFDDFARAIELLRSTAFELQSNKRWSSKFVFPFGPDALYEDLRFDSKDNASNDRRFFARSGELLYLMLSRATNGQELGRQLVQRLFNPATPLNMLVKAVQGETQRAPRERGVGYLPYLQNTRFDRLCDDWLAILARDIPVYDALDHIITITGLNMLLYFLECGKTTVSDVSPVEILCEVIARQRTRVRALSCDSYQFNQSLSLRAIKSFIEQVRTTTVWESALNSDDPNGECLRIMQERFQWPQHGQDDDVDVNDMNGEDLIARLTEKAEKRHEQHLGKIHNSWARAVGLGSRRLSRRLRYAPNDRLLKALVVTVVEQRMEFGEFLTEIHRRYGLVFGHAEGAHYIQENLVDQEALMDNAAYLETRLYGLGLVRRLSDSCAFVENPFSRTGES